MTDVLFEKQASGWVELPAVPANLTTGKYVRRHHWVTFLPKRNILFEGQALEASPLGIGKELP
jgi:hypothetical protein